MLDYQLIIFFTYFYRARFFERHYNFNGMLVGCIHPINIPLTFKESGSGEGQYWVVQSIVIVTKIIFTVCILKRYFECSKYCRLQNCRWASFIIFISYISESNRKIGAKNKNNWVSPVSYFLLCTVCAFLITSVLSIFIQRLNSPHQSGLEGNVWQ